MAVEQLTKLENAIVTRSNPLVVVDDHGVRSGKSSKKRKRTPN